MTRPNTYSVASMSTAKEFLDFIEERSPGSLFRGVADADAHRLVPSALRGDVVRPTNQEQVEWEARALLHFYDAAYFQGLPIPSWGAVSSSMRRIREKRGHTLSEFQAWPPHEIREFMALAQHHGVRTRLLDWSLDPMVAAYFAAASEADAEADNRLIGVWILDEDAHSRTLFFPSPSSPVPAPISVPYDINPNARAQHGVFTNHLVASSEFLELEPSRESVDEALARRIASSRQIHPTEDPPENIITVATLPAALAPQVLRQLDRRRINGSTMFPGYDGAVRAARERKRWESLS